MPERKIDMTRTVIPWSTWTANPVFGCSKPAAVPIHVLGRYVDYPVDKKWHKPGSSPECVRCYAEKLSIRRGLDSERRLGHHKGWTVKEWNERNAVENVQLRQREFKEIARLPVKDVYLLPSQRERIFMCSMGDIFHELVPDSFLRETWEAMMKYPHLYLLLTKRPERAATWPGPWPENIWLGTTCGHSITRWRLNALRASGARVRFVSAEPLVEDIASVLDLSGIHWVICGGESNRDQIVNGRPQRMYRPMDMEWARNLRDLCVRSGVAFFFKQDAGKTEGQRQYLVERDGRCFRWHQYPGELTDSMEIAPDNKKVHKELFPILTAAV
jgi:protein gp37